MTRKNEAITVSVNVSERQSLEKLAQKYGLMWGDRPNISAFIKAIANEVIPLGEHTPELALKAEIAVLERELREKKAKLG